MKNYIRDFEPNLNNILKKSLRLMTSGHSEKNFFIIKLSRYDFNDSLCNDFFYNYKRIQNHKLNLTALLENKKTHPAWIIVTAYYACYYMALDLNRLMGNFLITFQERELNEIFNEIKFDNHIPLNNPASSFNARVSINTDNEIEIKFSIASGKSHLLVWNYMNDNFFKKDDRKHSNYLTEMEYVSSILTGRNRWISPSQVRNKWNYQEPNLYDENGITLSKSFLANLENNKKAYKWIQRRKLDPSDENHASSLAFLYHYLSHSIDYLYTEYFNSFKQS
ncbi:MAG: hypothetical protein Q4A62_09130 [Eikenella sp.]|nr:hypothetical protein [Eikenella sp.]